MNSTIGLTLSQAIPLIYGDFEEAAVRLLFDISFFIIVTTIGLNIVFGIIVDTFAELRDEKVFTWMHTMSHFHAKVVTCSATESSKSIP